MRRGVMKIPPVPGKAPSARVESRGALLASALALAILAHMLMPSHRATAAPSDSLPEGPIVEVKVVGNNSVTIEQVRAKIHSRPGSTLSQRRIDADIQELLATKWFSDVRPYYDKSPDGKGYILTFVVTELPVLKSVEFRGMKGLKLKEVEQRTGLKKGNRADADRTRLAPAQIKSMYTEKGYDTAEVKLLEGGNRGDTRVVIQIFEGEKHLVRSTDFKGNVFASDATLRTKITSRRAIFGWFGKFQRDNLDEDVRQLTEYYQGQGFFEVRVVPVTKSRSGL